MSEVGTTLVVADLDGTLTFTGSAPEREVMTAWDAVMAVPGVRVVLATARSPRCVRRWFGHRLDRVSLVCCNGALVIPTTGSLTLRALPVGALRRAVDRLEGARAGFALEYGDYFVTHQLTDLPWMGTTHRRPLPPGARRQWHGVVKLSVETVAAARVAAAGLPQLRVLPHSSGDADIMAAGVGKEVAVAALRRGAERLVALGNDENDRGLLWAADSAYLVGDGLTDLDAAVHVRRIAATRSSVAGALTTLAHQLSGAGPRPGLVAPRAWAAPAW